MVASNYPQEKRNSPRIERNIPLKISGIEPDIVTETKNLSRSGAYCRVSRYIEPMTKLKLCFLLPLRKNGKVLTKKVSCKGVVVRTDSIPTKDNFYIAIFFNDIQNRDANYITEFVEQMVVVHSQSVN